MRAILRSASAMLPLLLVAAMACACSWAVPGHPTAADNRAPLSFGPDLTAAQLDGILLDAPAVNKLMGATGMTLAETYDTMPGRDGATVSDSLCIGTVFNTIDDTFKPGTYTGVLGRLFGDDRHEADEGLVLFANSAAAQGFWTASKKTWDRCAGTHIAYTPADAKSPRLWTPRQRTQAGHVIAVVSDLEGGDGYTCMHALTVKANVVVDVRTCGYDLGNQAIDLTNALTARFPG